jgi:Ca2+-transporting ATPase
MAKPTEDLLAHAREPDDVFAWLGATPDGLSGSEAAERLDRTGPNVLTRSLPVPAWRILLNQFLSPIIGVLLLAGLVTLLLQEWVDAAAIFLVLVVNAIIGFTQESRAQTEMRALESISTPSSRVLRDGLVETQDSALVVPGDVVLLESGDQVPADLRLFQVGGLQIDESMLTGEALAVAKSTEPVDESASTGDRTNIAYSGTLVTSGRGRGVVVATGASTEVGEINRLIQRPSGKSPLQELTHSLERGIGVVVGLVSLVLFVAGLILGQGFAGAFLPAVALAVALIPEALPIVVTIATSRGASRMARRGALIRTLPAVETLGSTTVICSDKTGTLTQNQLTVEATWSSSGREGIDGGGLARDVLRAGALTSEAEPSRDPSIGFTGDAVDVAIARAAVEGDAVSIDEMTADALAMTPYEPELGYSQALRSDVGGGRILYVKGSPEKVLSASTSIMEADGPSRLDVTTVLESNDAMARAGRRVIASAIRVIPDGGAVPTELPEPSGLTLLGLIGMIDPPRDGVAGAIRQCQEAGVRITIVTGDHPITAEAIGERLGLSSEAPPVTGAEMRGLDDVVLAARLSETPIAARVSPQDKLRIVNVLRHNGETVAVTGDGVNDAPALKAASIGVAMGKSGTDVAREAADVVLTDDNFVTIVNAVEEGRVTFAAIRKATFFLLSTSAAMLAAVSVNVFADLPILFLPVQLLWINIVTNGIQDVALATEPAEGDELTRPPRPADEGLLTRAQWLRVALSGLWIAAGVLLAFRWALETGYSETYARSLALVLLVMFNFFQAWNARSERRSVLSLSPLRNRFLLVAAIGSVLLQFGAMQWSVSADVLSVIPISAEHWLACIAAGSTLLVVIEIDKWIGRGRAARSTASPTKNPMRPRRRDQRSVRVP